MNITICIYNDILAAITISFNELIYFVNESNETVELLVILSNPSATDITVHTMSNNVTAISKYAHNYNLLDMNIYIYIYIYIYVTGPGKTGLMYM